MRLTVFALFVFGLTLTVMGGLERRNAWAQEGAGEAKPPIAGHRHKEPTAALFFSGRLARVGLNKDQKEKIRAIFLAHDPVLADASGRYVEKRRQMRILIDDTSATEDAISSLAAEIGRIEAELSIERNRILKEVAGLLTPEQTAKFKKGRSAVHKKESGQPR